MIKDTYISHKYLMFTEKDNEVIFDYYDENPWDQVPEEVRGFFEQLEIYVIPPSARLEIERGEDKKFLFIQLFVKGQEWKEAAFIIEEILERNPSLLKDPTMYELVDTEIESEE